jgi:hypothetical protein
MSKYILGDYDYQIPGSGRDALEWELGRLKAEIAVLKAFLTRAADALSDQHGMWIVFHENCKTCKLVAELRKAAQ